MPLLTVKEAREKLGLRSNPGVHYLVDNGTLKVRETLPNGARLFDSAEVERVKKERLAALIMEVKTLKST